MTNKEYYLTSVDYKDDCQRIACLFLLSLKEAHILWSQFSEYECAGWLGINDYSLKEFSHWLDAECRYSNET